MYVPDHFKLKDQKEIFEIIEKNNFGILVTGKKELKATHIPFILDRKRNLLIGHIAKANDQWKDFEKEVLVIFSGAHHYISPVWYNTIEAVPTWNFIAVHVYGEISEMTDKDEILDSLENLITLHEGNNSSYNFSNVSGDYKNKLLKGIFPFKIEIKDLQAKTKLSQNHPLERQELVIENLRKLNNDSAKEIAERMMKNIRDKNLTKKNLFND